MREDLDFLFDRAIRSFDLEFIECVFWLLLESGRDLESDILNMRILFVDMIETDSWTGYSKFSFLVGDSYLGLDWYTTKANNI